MHQKSQPDFVIPVGTSSAFINNLIDDSDHYLLILSRSRLIEMFFRCRRLTMTVRNSRSINSISRCFNLFCFRRSIRISIQWYHEINEFD
jgi:hypothetical protein